MSASSATPSPPVRLGKRSLADRLGDRLFYTLTAAASLLAVALVGLIVYELVKQAWPAITRYGLGFVTSRDWDPNINHLRFGALDFVYGTALTSFVAIIVAGPLAIAIALWLHELAPRFVRGTVGALVEMLAAIPSVVIGLWGIFVLAPFVQDHLDPALQSVLGWTPFFSGRPQLTGYMPAAIVLMIMVLPITASVSRELFRTVPQDLKEASFALGMTRWEMIRGVMLPYARGGLVAAVILGLARAIGEAIAVTQLIGGTLGIHLSLFSNGDTLASRIAAQYQGADTNIQVAALVYLALVLLVISLLVNFTAQMIVRRFELQRTGAG
ncbi:MAG: phosphate ABC transporter permease subunit PstC [Gaiellaceae bacterium]